MAPDESGEALKLRAEDQDDLAVISACLQDALVPVRDLAYVPEDRVFMFVANRFRWEGRPRAAPNETGYQRILCGVSFGEVAAVSYSGFRRTDDSRILSLLAIRSGCEQGAGAIDLQFSGGATIRLEVSRILCHVRDLGEPWPTRWQPRHDMDERA
jgi:Protein of unknown function (DUF2948)